MERARQTFGPNLVSDPKGTSGKVDVKSSVRTRSNSEGPPISRSISNGKPSRDFQNTDFSTDRKVDLLFKKSKVLEDRLKKNEKDLVAIRESSLEWQSSIVKLTDGQKVDKRLLHSTRDQLSIVRSKLDLLSSSLAQSSTV